MAVAPQFERERMVSDAVARATLRIGKPDRVAVKGDRIIVRSGNKRLVLRAYYSNSYDPNGVAILGGSLWSFEEGESRRSAGVRYVRCGTGCGEQSVGWVERKRNPSSFPE